MVMMMAVDYMRMMVMVMLDYISTTVEVERNKEEEYILE